MGKKSRKQKEYNASNLDLSSLDGLYREIQRAELPEPRLPSFSTKAVVEALAAENGLKFRDMTGSMKRAHNASAKRAIELFHSIGVAAIEVPDTIFFIEARPENFEASVFIARFAYFSMSAEPELKLKDDVLLSCVCWRGEDFSYFFKNPRTETPQQLRNGLAPLMPMWECTICLDNATESSGSVSYWVCNHSICTACAVANRAMYLEKHEKCPVCESNMVPTFTATFTG
jgi:hypothetical protein